MGGTGAFTEEAAPVLSALTPRDLAALLRDARQSKGLTQREAARMLGVHRQAVWKWENGCNLWRTTDVLTRLERYGLEVRVVKQ